MRTLIILAVAAVGLYAQAQFPPVLGGEPVEVPGQVPQLPQMPTLPPPTPVAVPQPVIAAPSTNTDIPKNWLGGGAAYNAYSSPNVNAWQTWATLLNRSQGLYMFTSHDVTSSLKKPYTVQSSTRMGVGMILRQFGPIYIVALGDAGAAASLSTVGRAISGGGMAIYKIGKSGWTFEGGFRYLNTNVAGGSTQRVWEMGFGHTF